MLLLYNDGRVLQLWSETVAVRRRMLHGLGDILWPYDNRGRMWPNFLRFVIQLRENPGKTSTKKLTRPGIEPGPAAREVPLLPLDHGGGLVSLLYNQ